MTLTRKLARLETIVAAQSAAKVPTFWTPARIDQWRAWVVRLLQTMPEPRALVVYVEMTMLPADRWGPVTRRLHDLACRGVDGRYDRAGWPYWSERAIALPDAVCEALERHPDAGFKIDHSCEDCGLEVPHLPYAGPALLATYPLFGGAVKHHGYMHRRYREAWERQKVQ